MRTSLLLGLAIGLLSACSREGPTQFIRQSPSGRYTAIISGFQETPKAMFIEHPVQAELQTASGDILGRLELYRGDSLDAAFSQRFEPPDWVSETVLRFRSSRVSVGSGVGELVVENKTDERLKLLRVRAEDMFVIVDLLPGARVVVPASPPVLSEVVSVDAEGRDSLGREIEYQAANFKQTNPLGGWRGRYLVVIEGGRIRLGLEQSGEPQH